MINHGQWTVTILLKEGRGWKGDRELQLHLNIFLETVTERASSSSSDMKRAQKLSYFYNLEKKEKAQKTKNQWLILYPPENYSCKEHWSPSCKSHELVGTLTGNWSVWWIAGAECGLAGTWAMPGWHGLRGYPHLCGFHFQEPHQVPLVEPRQRPCLWQWKRKSNCSRKHPEHSS